jgi:glycosyltransferase involved in cell wall biosynthesis
MGVTFVSRRDKDYPRYRRLRRLLDGILLRTSLSVLLPFSKRRFPRLWLRRRVVMHDFFISDFDSYVNDTRKGPWYAPSALWKYLFDRWSFHGSDYLLADTATHLRHWERLFGTYAGRSLVYPVLADEAVYRPAAPAANSVPRLLFYGYFIPLHGVDIILRALARCEHRGLDFTAEFIGTGRTLSASMALADELGLRQVSFNCALVPECELVGKIHASDIILGIFGSSAKARSVVPNKVYEGLACQRAVVTGDSPALREFFDDQDLLLTERDPTALADAIASLLLDPAARQGLAERGYAAYRRLADRSDEALQAFVRSIDEQRG